MILFGPQARIFVHAQPCDMRKSFDGLSGLVRSVFQADPLDGSLFLFFNRRRDRVKILHYDGEGMILWYKRLERGCFEMISSPEAVVEIDAVQLSLLLGGVSLASPRRRKPTFTTPGAAACS